MPDARVTMREARALLVPLLTGGGTRLKVLEIFQRAAAGSVRHLSAEDVHQALLSERIDVGLGFDGHAPL